MEKKKSKKLPFIIAGLAILIAVGSVVAYLMSNDGKQNDFVVGRGDDKVEELFNKPSKLSVGINPFQKEVAVKNTGENPCFVRVYMDFSDSSVKDYTYFYSDMTAETMPEFYKKDANGNMHDANGNIVDIDGNILDENGNKTGSKGGSPIIEDNWYKANSVDDSKKENWLDDKWVYVPDTNDGLYGYFYYTEPLKAGESTTDLINWVNTVFGEGAVKKFDIYVYSETVQTVGIDGTDYGIADTDGKYNWQEAWTKYLRDNLYQHEEPEKSYVLKAQNFASNNYNKSCYDADVASLGESPTSLAGMFSSEDCRELTDINFSADLSNISSFDNMFSGCSSALKNITIINTGETHPTINISTLFNRLTGLETITLTGFNITGIDSAFSTCGYLEKVSFTGGTITGNASTMFSGCSNLSSVNLEGLASTDNPTGMLSASAGKLTEVTVSGDLSQLTSFRGLWGGGSECRTILNTLKLNNTGTAPTITDEGEAFGSYSTNNQWSALEEIELKNMVAAGSSEQCLYKLCQGDANLQTAVITGDLSNISSLQYAYYGCSSLVSCDISTTTNLENLTTTEQMFYGCSKLISVSFGSENQTLTKMQSLKQMFVGTSLTSESFIALMSKLELKDSAINWTGDARNLGHNVPGIQNQSYTNFNGTSYTTNVSGQLSYTN